MRRGGGRIFFPPFSTDCSSSFLPGCGRRAGGRGGHWVEVRPTGSVARCCRQRPLLTSASVAKRFTIPRSVIRSSASVRSRSVARRVSSSLRRAGCVVIPTISMVQRMSSGCGVGGRPIPVTAGANGANPRRQKSPGRYKIWSTRKLLAPSLLCRMIRGSQGISPRSRRARHGPILATTVRYKIWSSCKVLCWWDLSRFWPVMRYKRRWSLLREVW